MNGTNQHTVNSTYHIHRYFVSQVKTEDTPTPHTSFLVY